MKKPRILWADDEIDLLRPYILFLEEKGYELLTANNGQDAIDISRTEPLDIVFLDENMPGVSGLEALIEIKEAQPTLPVVMITKSEEEDIMDQAIGEKIADYLIKPVNPKQILLTLKKHIHQQRIVSEHTNQNYQQEFSDIAYLINTASTVNEFFAVYKQLMHWELELSGINSEMHEVLSLQRQDANAAFSKFVARNYQSWLKDSTQRPLMSHDVMKKVVFPYLENGEKVCFVVIDNFRYDQWKIIQPLLLDKFTISDEQLYCTILPTATQYARNALFSGLMPQQIQELYPQYWVEEGDDEGKNLYEKELIQTLFDRYRKRIDFSYFKINESDFCEKIIMRLGQLKTDLNVIVLNFIDMLSHSRTESRMMRELAGDESAYRSLTLSWFQHSPTLRLFERMAKQGYKVILTTDHGTVRVQNPIQIIGDKNTNTNLRYKVGKSLGYNEREVFVIDHPKEAGLTLPNVSSTYAFCTNNDFFAYPNNYNYYVQHYKDSFQHGGISLEEMLVPIVVLNPKD